MIELLGRNPRINSMIFEFQILNVSVQVSSLLHASENNLFRYTFVNRIVRQRQIYNFQVINLICAWTFVRRQVKMYALLSLNLRFTLTPHELNLTRGSGNKFRCRAEYALYRFPFNSFIIPCNLMRFT